MKNNETKQKVVDAASFLFFQKGFHGTSVRDIAARASVNVSLISYYFNSKQGLLEYAVMNYYEMYLELLENELKKEHFPKKIDKLKNIIYQIIKYKTEHFQLTAFIQRELSLDSIFVREITVTYLAKENYILQKLFFSILKPQYIKQQSYLYMQLKGMIMSPFLLKHDWSNQTLDKKAYDSFLRNFTFTINLWLEFVAVRDKDT